MQYIKGIEAYHNTNLSAITLGKFDGLHQGHELLINKVIEHQKKDDVDGVVFAFDMSPMYAKLNKQPDFLLSNEEKAKRLDGRVNYFIDCPFDEHISSMEAEEFIHKVLVDTFHAKYIVIGTDFHFGYQKKGNWETLKQYESEYGFTVEVMDKLCHDGREISSTYIKEVLAEGNEELANRLLGYLYKKNFDKD